MGKHYNDVIMSAMASQITCTSNVCSAVCSGAHQTSKLRVTGLCVGNSPGPVNSPHKGPVTRKMFPFDDVIMDEVIMTLYGIYRAPQNPLEHKHTRCISNTHQTSQMIMSPVSGTAYRIQSAQSYTLLWPYGWKKKPVIYMNTLQILSRISLLALRQLYDCVSEVALEDMAGIDLDQIKTRHDKAYIRAVLWSMCSWQCLVILHSTNSFWKGTSFISTYVKTYNSISYEKAGFLYVFLGYVYSFDDIIVHTT